MKTPVTTADLHVLFVKEEGSQVLIGPRMGAGGFRHEDLLTELKFVQLWLENRRGVDRVLIDLTRNQYLRGRTLAGLILLKEHIPDGAEFAVCGPSPLLDAVLAKLDATDTVPVFETPVTAFQPSKRRPIRAFVGKVRAAVAQRRHGLLRVAAGLLVAATLLALVPLVTTSPADDYDRLLSIWEQLLSLRGEQPGSPELADFQQQARRSVAETAAGYRKLPKRTPVQELVLSAADALYENLSAKGVDEASEDEFVYSMESLADELQLSQRPSRSTHRGPRRPTLVE